MAELNPDAGAGLTALGINCTLKKSPEAAIAFGVTLEHGGDAVHGG